MKMYISSVLSSLDNDEFIDDDNEVSLMKSLSVMFCTN